MYVRPTSCEARHQEFECPACGVLLLWCSKGFALYCPTFLNDLWHGLRGVPFACVFAGMFACVQLCPLLGCVPPPVVPGSCCHVPHDGGVLMTTAGQLAVYGGLWIVDYVYGFMVYGK